MLGFSTSDVSLVDVTLALAVVCMVVWLVGHLR